MKKLLIPLFFLPLFSIGQNNTFTPPKPVDYIRFSAIFVSGAFEGLREAMKFYPDRLPDNCNPDLIWRNKYKNGDPAQGERFLGSTTIFVAFTDRYHAAGAIRTITGITYTAGVCIKFNGENRKGKRLWLGIGKELLTSFVCYNVGKTIVMGTIKNSK